MADTVGFAPTSEFSFASCLANKYLRLLGHVSILAEVVGFEPTPDFSAHGFQDRPLSLLGTLPQCPRIRKRAVTFRSSGKQFLITVTIRSNPLPFVSGWHPVNRQRISRLFKSLLAFANLDGSFREKG